MLLEYRIDLHFHDYKLAIEIDENEQSNRNIEYEIKRQKAIEEELGCEFFRINLEKEDFNIFKVITEILRYIKQSSKET